jgi:hypothetical protein
MKTYTLMKAGAKPCPVNVSRRANRSPLLTPK